MKEQSTTESPSGHLEIKALVAARKAAESAVVEMSDGPLKIAAFETILRKLLDAQLSAKSSIGREEPQRIGREAVAKGSSSGTTSRITSLVDEGFFSAQRSLADIQGALAERGWHYDQNLLSTPVTRLVRKRVLRRTQAQASEGTKKVWKYSIY
jgi:hypothetical protein